MVDPALLAQAPLFRDFEPGELEAIGRLATRASYPDGTTVLAQGDLGRHLFVILDGSADVIQESAGGERMLLAQFGPGDFFGERAALKTGSRTADVVARGRLDCAVLTQWDVLAVLRHDRGKAVRFLERLRERYVTPAGASGDV